MSVETYERPTGRPSGSSSAEDEAWRRFLVATNAQEYCGAWLDILCRQLSQPGLSVTAAAVLLEAQTSNTFVPVAVWPEPTLDMARLGKIAEQALSERRGVVQPGGDSGAITQIAYPVQGQSLIGAVALEVRGSGDTRPLLRQLHWGTAWLDEFLLRRELKSASERGTRIGSVMEAVAVALGGSHLQQSLFEVTNHLARHLQCSRVAIGLTRSTAIKLAALSDAAWFERNSAAARLYTAAMGEAFDRQAVVEFGAATEGPQASQHAQLARETGAAAIVSVPLMSGARCRGVLTLEHREGVFSKDNLTWLETLCSLLPAIIDDKQRADRSYLGRIGVDLHALGDRLFGPRHLVWKFAASALLLVIGILALVKIDYRVTAKTVIEGEVQRVLNAPFEGFIASSNVRAGDTVHEGDLLCQLDDRELLIEQARWSSEKEQDDKKLRQAIAEDDLGQVQITSAQLKEAEAQLNLANERIRRSKIVAPFDGIVISGDLSQLAGSPVEQGKKLFEVAPLQSYRVILQVDEREIRHIADGQTGRLIISGIAGDPTPFHVSKITPVATAEDGRNFFRVEADLDKTSLRLRPGMEGVGKIEVGRRRLWWILTHSFTDWLRLTLWTWIP